MIKVSAKDTLNNYSLWNWIELDTFGDALSETIIFEFFFQSVRNFLNHLLAAQWSTALCKTNIFRCFCSVMARFELIRHTFPYVHHQLSNLTWSEALHNRLGYQLARYYLAQRIEKTYAPLTNTYQNIEKRLNAPCKKHRKLRWT